MPVSQIGIDEEVSGPPSSLPNLRIRWSGLLLIVGMVLVAAALARLVSNRAAEIFVVASLLIPAVIAIARRLSPHTSDFPFVDAGGWDGGIDVGGGGGDG